MNQIYGTLSSRMNQMYYIQQRIFFEYSLETTVKLDIFSVTPRPPPNLPLHPHILEFTRATSLWFTTQTYLPWKANLLWMTWNIFRLPFELYSSLQRIFATAKSKCCCSIWKRKGPGTKSISVIAKGAWYKNNFIGLNLYRKDSELIPITGFVPSHFCMV